MAFIKAVCPLPSFRRMADVCCGMGRHARALAACGYEVTGVERDRTAVEEAKRLGGGPMYVQEDVRDYLPEADSFDGLAMMSQSFGFFDAEGNREILARLAAGLRAKGRIVLDLWHPDFFRERQGRREFALPQGTVGENKMIAGNRLFVQLDYPDGTTERFEWEMFSVSQMEKLARSIGCAVLTACTDFDPETPPAPDRPRVQYVLETG